MILSDLVTSWLTPPRFPAPAFPIEPTRFSLTLPEVPLEGFPAAHYPEVLGVHKTVACYEWPSESNNSPTVLLAHGWGGCAAQFAAWLKPLHEAGYRVLAYDAPAHGASEGTLASAPANAATLKALADWSGQPLHGVIAHSLGAIATTLALAAGIQAQQLVFLGPVCYVADGLKNHGLREGLSDSEADALVAYFQSEFSTDLTLLSALKGVPSPPPTPHDLPRPYRYQCPLRRGRDHRCPLARLHAHRGHACRAHTDPAGPRRYPASTFRARRLSDSSGNPASSVSAIHRPVVGAAPARNVKQNRKS